MVAEVLRVPDTELGSGLGSEEGARRLKERGPNELEDRGGRKPWSILWEQDLAIAVALGTAVFWAVEIEKRLARRKGAPEGRNMYGLVRREVDFPDGLSR